MRRLIAPLFAALLVGGMVAPAVAQPAVDPIPPTFRMERVYFHCLGGDKAQNVHRLQGEVGTWDTHAPTQSYQAGAGCGQYENLLTGGGDPSPHDLVFEGTFTGNLDALSVELYEIHASSYRASNKSFLVVSLTIDGEEVHNSAFHQFPTVDTASGAVQKLNWSYSELNYDTEEGDGTQVHTVRLSVASANEEQAIWVWDTSEVPAGLTFNPAALEKHNFVVNRGVE